MGMNYTISKEDVKSWIDMTDTDGNGTVDLLEY